MKIKWKQRTIDEYNIRLNADELDKLCRELIDVTSVYNLTNNEPVHFRERFPLLAQIHDEI